MRIVLSLLMLVVLLVPEEARAQQFLVHGAAGPIVNADAGYSLAAGIGVTAGPRVTILGSFDQTHLPTTTTPLPNGFAYTVLEPAPEAEIPARFARARVIVPPG